MQLEQHSVKGKIKRLSAGTEARLNASLFVAVGFLTLTVSMTTFVISCSMLHEAGVSGGLVWT